MAIPIQRRRDTAANWTSVNPILIDGQEGFETDTGQKKMGDGLTAWNSLGYSGGGGSGDMVLASVQTVTGKKTFGSAGAVGKLAVAGTTSGSTIIDATAAAGSGTVTLPTTGTLATLAGTESLSNKTLVAPALGTPASGTLTNCTGLPVSTGVSGLAANVATFLATPSSANLAAALTDETGTGASVFANSPTLVTPALGTPSSATLTNATGLPVSTGITGLGTGVATFLATPSSANLAAALTDETGTGANVFANSPTLVTPALGTPSAAVLTNATGLPLTTGVTGILPHGNLGTGGGGSTKFLREDSTYQTISGGGDALVANPLSQFASTTSAQLAGVISDETGTGALVFANTPTLVTPVLGVATATTVNKVALTAPATGSTLTIADGKTLTSSNTLTIAGTDGSTLNVGTGGTLGSLALLSAAPAGTLTGSTLASGVTASSLTSVGTITSGTWNGTQLAVFYGGTGAGTFTDGGVLIGNGTSAIQSTSAGTAGQVLISGGSGVDPSFGSVPSHNHAASEITSGTIATARLGSGTANSTTYLRGDQTWQTVSGSGDVVGPASATDAVPALFDGTTGKLLKNSTPTGTGNPVLHNGPTLAVPHADSFIFDGSISGAAVVEAYHSSGTTTYFILPPTTGSSGQMLTTDGAGQTSWSSTPTLGNATGTTGAVLFKGTTSGTVTFTVASAAGTHTIKLPTADGSANQVLKTDGSGQWGWVTPSAGSVATDTIWNAAGDLAYGTGSDTASVLSIGDSMAKLYNNGSAPFWGTANNTWTIEEHFFGVSGENFSYSNSGGSNNYLSAQANADHPGVLRLGATNNGNYAGIIIGGSTGWLTFGGGEAVFEGTVYIENLSDGTDSYVMRIGFIESAAGNQVDGVFLLHDHNNANWQVQCRAASTGSASASNTAVATGWTKVKVVVNAAGTSAAFYINGTQLNVSPLTSNIPTGSNMTAVGGQINKTAGTTVRYVHFDYMRATGKLTNPL